MVVASEPRNEMEVDRSIDEANPWLFQSILKGSTWWILLIVFPVLCLSMFHNIHSKRLYSVSLFHLTSFNLLLSLAMIIPFLAYAWNGISWTGMSLNPVRRTMIESRHAVLMGMWSVTSTIQMISYMVGKQSVHNILGKFGIFLLLPSIFIEMHTNAVVVFWPDKPIFLYRAITGVGVGGDVPAAVDVSLWNRVLYTVPMFYSVATPLTMIHYWYRSWQSLKSNKRNIRLHAIYMSMLMATTLNAGILRWLIRLLEHYTQCPSHTESETTIVIQMMGQNYGCIIEMLLLTGLYTIMTPKERSERGAQQTFYWYVFHITVTWLGSAYLDVPSFIHCTKTTMTTDQKSSAEL